LQEVPLPDGTIYQDPKEKKVMAGIIGHTYTRLTKKILSYKPKQLSQYFQAL
jgi:hypothetical protein